MKLSVELEKWRADRPDEWKMDEFIRNAAKIESENDALSQKLRTAQHESEALAAAVDRMSTSIKLSAKKWEGAPEVEPTFWNLLRVVNESTKQHLRDVLAEAVISAANSCVFVTDINTGDGVVKCEICLFEDLEQYAELVKDGEE